MDPYDNDQAEIDAMTMTPPGLTAINNINADNVSSDLNNNIGGLRSAISTLSHNVSQFAKTTAGMARNVAASATKDINVDKQGFLMRNASVIGGPFGAIISKAITDSGVGDRIGGYVKDGVGRGIHSIGNTVKSMFGRGGSGYDSQSGYMSPSLMTKSVSIGNGAIVKELHQNLGTQLIQANKYAADELTQTKLGNQQIVTAIRDLDDSLQGKQNGRTGAKPQSAAAAASAARQTVINNYYSATNTATPNNQAPSINVDNESVVAAINALNQNFTDNANKTGKLGFIGEILGGTRLGTLFKGKYVSDIAKSNNPLETLVSASLQIYRWQRLYGELQKKQLNELIKLSGGEEKDVVGEHGLLKEAWFKQNDKMKKALGPLGGFLGDMIFFDQNKFDDMNRAQAAGALHQVINKPSKDKGFKGLKNNFKDWWGKSGDRQLGTQGYTYDQIIELQQRLAAKYNTFEKLDEFHTDTNELGALKEKKDRRDSLRKKLAKGKGGWFGTSFRAKARQDEVAELEKEDYTKIGRLSAAYNKKYSTEPKNIFDKIGDFKSNLSGVVRGSLPVTIVKSLISNDEEVIPMAKGGIINKPIKGKASDGTPVTIGEKGREAVIPLDNKDSIIGIIAKDVRAIRKNSDKNIKSISSIAKAEIDENKQHALDNERAKKQAIWDKVGAAKEKKGGFGKTLKGIGGFLIRNPWLLGIAGMLLIPGAGKWMFSSISNFAKGFTMIKKVGPAISWIPKFISGFSKVFPTMGKALTGVSKFGHLGKIAKIGFKFGAKNVAKTAVKKIPIIGPLISMMFAINRFRKGEVRGGILEMFSGLSQLVDFVAPGVGTAISLGFDLINMLMDINAKGTTKDIAKTRSKPFSFGRIAHAGIRSLPLIGPILRIQDGIKFWKEDKKARSLWEFGKAVGSILPVGAPIISAAEWLYDIVKSWGGGNKEEVKKENKPVAISKKATKAAIESGTVEMNGREIKVSRDKNGKITRTSSAIAKENFSSGGFSNKTVTKRYGDEKSPADESINAKLWKASEKEAEYNKNKKSVVSAAVKLIREGKKRDAENYIRQAAKDHKIQISDIRGLMMMAETRARTQVAHEKKFASGGFLNKAVTKRYGDVNVTAGEAGTEAIVPLTDRGPGNLLHDLSGEIRDQLTGRSKAVRSAYMKSGAVHAHESQGKQMTKVLATKIVDSMGTKRFANGGYVEPKVIASVIANHNGVPTGYQVLSNDTTKFASGTVVENRILRSLISSYNKEYQRLKNASKNGAFFPDMKEREHLDNYRGGMTTSASEKLGLKENESLSLYDILNTTANWGHNLDWYKSHIDNYNNRRNKKPQAVTKKAQKVQKKETPKQGFWSRLFSGMGKSSTYGAVPVLESKKSVPASNTASAKFESAKKKAAFESRFTGSTSPRYSNNIDKKINDDNQNKTLSYSVSTLMNGRTITKKYSFSTKGKFYDPVVSTSTVQVGGAEIVVRKHQSGKISRRSSVVHYEGDDPDTWTSYDGKNTHVSGINEPLANKAQKATKIKKPLWYKEDGIAQMKKGRSQVWGATKDLIKAGSGYYLIGNTFGGIGKGVGDTVKYTAKGIGSAVGGVLGGAGQAAWGGIKGAGQAIGGIGKGIGQAGWGALKGVGQAGWGILKGAGQATGGVAKGAWKGVKGLGGGIWEILKGNGEEGLNKILVGIKDAAVETVKGLGKGAWSIVKGLGKGIWSTAKGLAKGTWSALKGVATGMLTLGKGIAKGTWTAIKGIGKGAWNLGKAAVALPWNVAKGVTKGAWKTGKALVTAPWKIAKGIGNMAAGAVKWAFGSNKPKPAAGSGKGVNGVAGATAKANTTEGEPSGTYADIFRTCIKYGKEKKSAKDLRKYLTGAFAKHPTLKKDRTARDYVARKALQYFRANQGKISILENNKLYSDLYWGRFGNQDDANNKKGIKGSASGALAGKSGSGVSDSGAKKAGWNFPWLKLAAHTGLIDHNAKNLYKWGAPHVAKAAKWIANSKVGRIAKVYKNGIKNVGFKKATKALVKGLSRRALNSPLAKAVASSAPVKAVTRYAKVYKNGVKNLGFRKATTASVKGLGKRAIRASQNGIKAIANSKIARAAAKTAWNTATKTKNIGAAISKGGNVARTAMNAVKNNKYVQKAIQSKSGQTIIKGGKTAITTATKYAKDIGKVARITGRAMSKAGLGTAVKALKSGNIKVGLTGLKGAGKAGLAAFKNAGKHSATFRRGVGAVKALKGGAVKVLGSPQIKALGRVIKEAKGAGKAAAKVLKSGKGIKAAAQMGWKSLKGSKIIGGTIKSAKTAISSGIKAAKNSKVGQAIGKGARAVVGAGKTVANLVKSKGLIGAAKVGVSAVTKGAKGALTMANMAKKGKNAISAAKTGFTLAKTVMKGGIKTLMSGGLKAGLKAGVKGVAKGGLKGIAKKIPILGTVLSLFFAFQRFKKGEWGRGIIELLSGVSSLVPGIGTGISIVLDLLNMFLDHKMSSASKDVASVKEKVPEKKKEKKGPKWLKRFSNLFNKAKDHWSKGNYLRAIGYGIAALAAGNPITGGITGWFLKKLGIDSDDENDTKSDNKKPKPAADAAKKAAKKANKSITPGDGVTQGYSDNGIQQVQTNNLPTVKANIKKTDELRAENEINKQRKANDSLGDKLDSNTSKMISSNTNNVTKMSRNMSQIINNNNGNTDPSEPFRVFTKSNNELSMI